MRWVALKRQKLLSFLQERIGPDISGKKLKRALEANVCRINGKIERFASSEIERGAVIELAEGWQKVDSRIESFLTLYEDKSFLVVSKPAGWVCSPENCRKQFGPSIQMAHRLDKETTGVLILAKNKTALDAVEKQFKDRLIEKEYLAIVDGIPEKNGGVQKGYFAKKKSFQGQTIWGTTFSGQIWAETAWEKVCAGSQETLIRCYPVTGRTHQIRVHMAEMNHPILIDRQYAKSYRSSHLFQRPLLHAARVSFTHPLTALHINVTAGLPADFASALKRLNIYFNDPSSIC